MRVLAIAVVMLGACARPPSPFMHPAPRAGAIRDAGAATVVFVHHAGTRTAACAADCAAARDGWHDYGSPRVRIVDATGEFLGDSDPDTSFAVTVRPGPHTFVAWTDGDAHAEGREPATDAIAGDLAAGRIYVVDVRARIFSHTSGKVTRYSNAVELHALPRADDVSVADLVRGLAWWEPARDAGSERLAGDLALPGRLRQAAALAALRLEPGDGY